jgi:hypothetical protein
VTVPTITTVLLLDFSDKLATILETETGGLLMRDMKRRRRMTLLKAASVRPVGELISAGHEWNWNIVYYLRAKKRYSFTSSLR